MFTSHSVILLCSWWVILRTTFSMVSSPPQDFHAVPVGNSSSYDDGIYVVNENISTITILIKLGERVENRLTGTFVHYRPKSAIMAPPTLIKNSTAGYYVAEEAHGIYDTGEVGHPHYRKSASPSRQEIIVLSNLRFPGTKYELEIISFRENNTLKRAQFEVSTRPLKPSNPPKTGTGCFHVYSMNSTHRDVKIYWQHVQDLTMMYQVIVYVEGDPHTPVFTKVGLMRTGFIWTNINWKRHYFVFYALNEAGYSEDTSTVEVPAQEDILPPVSTEVFRSVKSGTFVLWWVVPRGVKVRNYTVSWYDMLDREGMMFMEDFVYLGNGGNMFRVKGDAWVGLALSVNTEIGSSGLHPARYADQDVWTFE